MKFWKEILKISIPFSIPVFLIVIIMNVFKITTGYLHLILFAFIYTIIYSLTCYFISMNNYEKEIINKVLRKVHITR